MTSIKKLELAKKIFNALELEKLDTLDTPDTKIVIDSTYILELEYNEKERKN